MDHAEQPGILAATATEETQRVIAPLRVLPLTGHSVVKPKPKGAIGCRQCCLAECPVAVRAGGADSLLQFLGTHTISHKAVQEGHDEVGPGRRVTFKQRGRQERKGVGVGIA